METSILLLKTAGPFVVGVLSHIFYFHRGEHHLHGKFYFDLFVASLFSISLLKARLDSHSTTFITATTTITPFLLWDSFKYKFSRQSISNSLHKFAILTSSAAVILTIKPPDFIPGFILALTIGIQYLAGVYTSLFIYRLFFNPLNRFPGPLTSRLSALSLSFRLRNRDSHLQFQSLHEQYGPIVRIGPNTLSIISPSAVPLVHGTGSVCTKPAFYDFGKPMVSLQAYRAKKDHDARRKVWSAAFTGEALKGYEKRVQVYRRKLLSNLLETKGDGVNVTKWFNSYAFDVMGDLTFGKPFGLMENGEHWAITLIQKGFEPLGFMLPDWFFRFMMAMPVVSRGWWAFLDFSERQMDERLKLGDAEVPDITSALMVPLKGQKPTDEDWNVLRGDAQLVVSAGSDTTANALTCIIYDLALHPAYIDALRAELSPHISPDGEFLNENIVHLKLLNAIINETLRLHPAVPTQVSRETPQDGLVIDEVFVPGHTLIMCPQWVMSRQSEYYERPHDFIPERWTTSPELIRDKRSYMPFLIGPYNCIGKPLALLNLRTTLARLVMAFDFEFGPGEDGTRFERDMTEHFGFTAGDLMVSFKERK